MADIYYVYTLENPLNSEIFYVGKGCKDRATSHERKVRRKSRKKFNSELYDVIKSILDSNENVIVNYIQKGISEEAALALEEKIIKDIGIENLANKRLKGTMSAKSRKPNPIKILIKWMTMYWRLKDKRLVEVESALRNDNIQFDHHGIAWKFIEDFSSNIPRSDFVRLCDKWIEKFYYKKVMYLDWIEYGKEEGQTIYLDKNNCEEDLRKAYAGGKLAVYMFRRGDASQGASSSLANA